MDYVKTIGTLILTGFIVHKVGDIKMILYILFVAAAFLVAVYAIPQLEGSTIRALVSEVLTELPGMIAELLDRGGAAP